MNLYTVGDYRSDWVCYCFATTVNRARTMVADHFGEKYIHMRGSLLKRGVNVSCPVVVDCAEHELYPKVVECGYRYAEDGDTE
jgi:hypothetical protein